MIIKRKQFDLLGKFFAGEEQKRMAVRIRSEFPETTQQYNEEELKKIIDRVAETASQLKIEGEELVYRLLRINFLNKMFTSLPYFQKVIVLVLSNTEASGQARINFIETNLLTRQAELMAHS